MVYNFFDKKTGGGAIKNEIISTKELAEELHKTIIRKFEKLKVQSIWGAHFTAMQLISKFNKESCFLLCVIDILGKYSWVISFKNKKKILQLLMLFKKSERNLIANQTKYG